MDDDDFRALIEILAEQLRGIGAAGIADERHYVRVDDSFDGEARLLEPQERLLEMLAAFERKVAIEDRNTFLRALEMMQDPDSGGGPSGAVIETMAEEGRSPINVDLSHAPDLGTVRAEIRSLRARASEARRLPGASL